MRTLVKLVRDNVQPLEGEEIRPANTWVGKQLALKDKLHEEAAEVCRDPDDPAEYADLLEVLLEMARHNGVSWSSIEGALLRKREEKGAFRRGMIWIMRRAG